MHDIRLVALILVAGTWGLLQATEAPGPLAFVNSPGRQMAILITRLRNGQTMWDPPARFFVAPDQNVTSATLFGAGNGELHHYNGLGDSMCRGFSMLKRVSTDQGVTWSVPRLVHEYPDEPASMKTFTGEPRLWPHMDIVVLKNGTLILPSDVGGGDACGTVL